MNDNLTIFGTNYTSVTGIKAKGTGNGTLTYVRPTGTKSITANGTGIDVAAYASVDVAVETGLDLPTFTITMDENDNVTNVTCSKTFAECKALGFGSNAYAVVAGADGGFVGQFYSGNTSNLEYVFYVGGIPAMGLTYHSNGTIQFKESAASVASLTVTKNGTYESGDTKVWNSVTVNVPTPTPTLQSKTATPTEQQQTVSPDSGYDGLSSVTVDAIPPTYVGSGITRRTSSDLTASGATVTVPAGHYAAQASKAVASGTEGTPTATKGSVSNHAVTVTPKVTNDAGYIAGGTHSGTGVTVAASELVDGMLAINSSGTKDVTNYASASVKAGSATASATKSSVSNHSVTVTPSVTCTAGWVTAGTANGTAVTVSASELVSGTYSVDSSGTKDITNYASISVPSGSATVPASITATVASVSAGTNTLTLTKSVSVTPSVTAGYVSSGTAGDSSVSLTANITTKAAATITPGTTNQTIAAGTYLTGAQTIAGDADLIADNIISTANIFGVQGSVVVQNYYTGSSEPSSSLGQNGDIYLQG